MFLRMCFSQNITTNRSQAPSFQSCCTVTAVIPEYPEFTLSRHLLRWHRHSVTRNACRLSSVNPPLSNNLLCIWLDAAWDGLFASAAPSYDTFQPSDTGAWSARLSGGSERPFLENQRNCVRLCDDNNNMSMNWRQTYKLVVLYYMFKVLVTYFESTANIFPYRVTVFFGEQQFSLIICRWKRQNLDLLFIRFDGNVYQSQVKCIIIAMHHNVICNLRQTIATVCWHNAGASIWKPTIVRNGNTLPRDETNVHWDNPNCVNRWRGDTQRSLTAFCGADHFEAFIVSGPEQRLYVRRWQTLDTELCYSACDKDDDNLTLSAMKLIIYMVDDMTLNWNTLPCRYTGAKSLVDVTFDAYHCHASLSSFSTWNPTVTRILTAQGT